MPTYYKRDTSGTTNWNSTTSWSTVSSTSAVNTGGAGGTPGFPSSTTADPVIFDASSSSVTVNVASSCAGLTISNTYTGTFTRTNSLSVGSGGVTLGSSMVLAGLGQLTIVASCTLIANSVLWNAPLATLNNIILTFSDSWQVTDLTIAVVTQVQLNGVGINLYVSGNYNAGTGGGYVTQGTINVILNGTGGVLGGNIGHNLEINTTGAITQSSFAFGNAAVRTYKITTFGTYSASSCILSLSGSPTIDLGTTPTGRVLGGISVSSNPIVTIVNDIYISSYSQNTTQATFNTSTSSKIYVSTSLQVITPAYNLTGNVDFIINGNCTWSGTGGVGVNLEINAPSSNVTVTFTGSFLNSKTLKYTSALTFSAGSSNITFGNSTLDLGSSLWGSFNTVFSNTVTIIGDANFAGNMTSNQFGNNYTINGGNLKIGGNFTASSSGFLNGTATLVFNRSTPTQIFGSNFSIRVNLLIDKSGGATVTVTNAVTWGTIGITLLVPASQTLILSAGLTLDAGTFDCSAGTFTPNLQTVSLSATTRSINMGSTNKFYNLTTTATNSNVIMLSNLDITNNFTISGSCNFNGAFDIIVGGDLSGGTVVNATPLRKLIITGTSTNLSTISTFFTGTSPQLEINCESRGFRLTGTLGVAVFNYLASNTGSFITTGSTMRYYACTINMNGKTVSWDILSNTVAAGTTGTILSDVYCVQFGPTANSDIINSSGGSYFIIASGSTGAISFISGTAGLRFVGSSNAAWNQTAATTNGMRTIEFAKTAPGTVSIPNSFTYGGILKYVSGAVTHAATLTLGTGSTVDTTSAVPWNNITIPAGATITISSLFYILGTLAITSGTTTFAGTAGWNCGTLTCSTASSVIVLQEAITYTTRINAVILGTNAGRILMRSSDTSFPYVLAKWTLANTPAAQSMTYVSATAIDSSEGMTIYSFQGLTNGIDASTINWFSGASQGTKAFTFVS